MSSYISYGANLPQNHILINQEIEGNLSENISIYSSKLPIYIPSDYLFLKEIALISSSLNFNFDIELISGSNLNSFSSIHTESNILSSNGFIRKALPYNILIPNRLLYIKLKPNISCIDLSITLSLGT